MVKTLLSPKNSNSTERKRALMAENYLTNSYSPSPGSPLLEFYTTLHKYITDFGIGEQETNDIQESVEEMVHKFADLVETIEPMFKAKSIEGVGSFYEKTKILRLDEFDFLYVIDELSDETKVDMEKVFFENILGKAVKIKDLDYFQASKWLIDADGNGNYYLGVLNFLPCRKLVAVENMHEGFTAVFMKAAKTIEGQSLVSKKSTGTLYFFGHENSTGPNVELWFEWKPIQGKSFVIKSDKS